MSVNGSVGFRGQGVMKAANVNFTGDDADENPYVVLDGQLLIGSTAFPNIQVGTITSPSGTITIGYASPNITIDLAGGAVAIDQIGVDAFTGPGTNPVDPDGTGLVTINGTIVAAQLIPLRTHSTALNQLAVETQYASAQAVDTAAASGMAHFDSAQFSVSATGFVQSLASVAFVWQDSAPVAMANYNGYFATGAGVYTLPAGVADGDTVEIIDQIGGGVVVTAQGGDTIRMGNVDSSVNGTATTTQISDGARFIFRSTGQFWISQPAQTGNWILA